MLTVVTRQIATCDICTAHVEAHTGTLPAGWAMEPIKNARTGLMMNLVACADGVKTPQFGDVVKCADVLRRIASILGDVRT